jgi:ubiquitin related modifier 1
MQIQLKYSGGLELLFKNQKEMKIDLPTDIKTVGQLIPWITTNKLQERPELFQQGDSVRPGILVLINDSDWELEGELEYVLNEKDTITFISTLHGG